MNGEKVEKEIIAKFEFVDATECDEWVCKFWTRKVGEIGSDNKIQ